jgi:uncharacterized SAM-binding protein YcdF (DUF218 family)
MSTAVENASSARATTWAGRIRRLGVLVLVLTGLGAGAWLAREPLLRGLADLWIVSDALAPADAVVVLGGQIEVRPFAAADLYQRGLVRKVLLSSNVEGRAVVIGGAQGHMEANRRVLLTLGVPENAIETFGQGNSSTSDEVTALRQWTERHEASSIIIPTEPFATRRVRWAMHRAFADRDIRILVLSVDPPGYTRTEWWKSAAGLITFQNEVMKYIYYRLNY